MRGLKPVALHQGKTRDVLVRKTFGRNSAAGSDDALLETRVLARVRLAEAVANVG